MATLPKQVREQLEATERFDQEVRDAQAQAQQPDPAEPQDPPPAPPEPPAPPPAPEPPAPPSVDWEAKFRTLQGVHRADMARMNSQVADLQAAIDELKKRPAETPKAPEPRAKVSKITEKDTKEFGEDLIDVIRRAAEEIVSDREVSLQEKLEKSEARYAELKEQITSVSANQGRTEQMTFQQALASRLPEWEQINTDQQFLDWLSQPDPLSGVMRQELLNDAVAKGDVDRTVRLFTIWKPAAPPPPPSAPAADEDDKRRSLEAQVQPGSTRVNPQPNGSSKKIWSQSEITQFYSDVQKKRLTAAEAAIKEAEIDLAVRENRVR